MDGPMMAQPKRRKKKCELKAEAPAPSIPAFVPDFIAPSSCSSSSLRPCDEPRCGAHWRGVNGSMTRDMGDGTSEPVRHVTFEVFKRRPANVERIFENGKEVVDIWPLRYDAAAVRAGLTVVETLRRWLCPTCYSRAEEMGWDVWAAEHWWVQSVDEEVAEQYDLAIGSKIGDVMHELEQNPSRRADGRKLPESSNSALRREIKRFSEAGKMPGDDVKFKPLA